MGVFIVERPYENATKNVLLEAVRLLPRPLAYMVGELRPKVCLDVAELYALSRILTCRSLRPRNTIVPFELYRTRSRSKKLAVPSNCFADTKQGGSKKGGLILRRGNKITSRNTRVLHHQLANASDRCQSVGYIGIDDPEAVAYSAANVVHFSGSG